MQKMVMMEANQEVANDHLAIPDLVFLSNIIVIIQLYTIYMLYISIEDVQFLQLYKDYKRSLN